MSEDQSITYHSTVVQATPSRFYGEIYVKFLEEVSPGFFAEREEVISTLYPFASETTARKYTKRELNKVIKEFPKYKLKEQFNVYERPPVPDR